MMDPLGMLVILFAAMSVVSIVALLALVLLKEEKKKKYVVYFLGIWGMVIAGINVNSLPMTVDFMGEIMRALVLGIFGAAALLTQLCIKKPGFTIAARVMAAVSVVGGIVATFLL